MNPVQLRKNTLRLKELARRHGFDYCGVAKAEFLKEEAPRLESWLRRGLHGHMEYMERWFDLRLDPRKLVPGAKSVIALAVNYYPRQEVRNPDGLKISRYAYGKDYHKVIRTMLKRLIVDMKSQFGAFSYRFFTDSGPVLEKAWAARAGLGWLGKHSNLIIKRAGSYFFLTEIISDLEFEYDTATADFCGTCTRCMDACPTGAITAPYVVDGSRCISYFTIELKEKTPEEYRGAWKHWIFGCDICQEVCPWNRFSSPHKISDFEPGEVNLLQWAAHQWLETTDEIFATAAATSPLRRAGLRKIQDSVRSVVRLD